QTEPSCHSVPSANVTPSVIVESAAGGNTVASGQQHVITPTSPVMVTGLPSATLKGVAPTGIAARRASAKHTRTRRTIEPPRLADGSAVLMPTFRSMNPKIPEAAQKNETGR